MTMTVDVVVVGTTRSALAAAVEAAQSGKRVLVITRTRGSAVRRLVLRATVRVVSKRITVLTEAEVECVAGIGSVEAVLARHMRTGRRIDINTAALLTFDEEPQTGIAAQQEGVARC